jgi:hypothetical protein
MLAGEEWDAVWHCSGVTSLGEEELPTIGIVAGQGAVSNSSVLMTLAWNRGRVQSGDEALRSSEATCDLSRN